MPNKNKCTPGITYNAVRKHKPNERYNTMELYFFFCRRPISMDFMVNPNKFMPL